MRVIKPFVSVGIIVLATPAFGWAQDGRDTAERFFRGALRNFLAPSQEGSTPAPPSTKPQLTSKLYMTTTADEWKLVARRYWLVGKVDTTKLPVVLCHGFAYNSRFFDLAPSISLARYLAKQGFDVWCVDLRGAGKSSKWALSANAGAERLIGRLASQAFKEKIPSDGFVSLDPKYSRWNMDHHIVYDVPAVVDLVKRETGAKQISWIGHSMGGNVMLAYLARYGDPSIAQLATVGSQLTISNAHLFIQFLFELAKRRQLQIAGQTPSFDELFASMNGVFFNEENTDTNVIYALATSAHDTPSLGLTRQYLDFSRTGRLRENKNKFTYTDSVGRIRCRCLFVGGSVDQLAPPPAQQFLYENVSSKDKTMMILGRRWGFSTDYGHNDSLVGRNSAAEVYPFIADWLSGASVGK